MELQTSRVQKPEISLKIKLLDVAAVNLELLQAKARPDQAHCCAIFPCHLGCEIKMIDTNSQ